MTGRHSSAVPGARSILIDAGWTPDTSDATKWWRDGTYATARAGVMSVKATLSTAEMRAFAVLADIDEAHPERAASDFEVDIRAAADEIVEMLLAKNAAYGDSALSPLRVFSRASVLDGLAVRIDDKLSRLARGQAAGEDAETDLLGYLLLRRVARARETSEREDHDALASRMVPVSGLPEIDVFDAAAAWIIDMFDAGAIVAAMSGVARADAGSVSAALRERYGVDHANTDQVPKSPAILDRAPHSVRQAMRDAGVEGWEMGSGKSSADAIREIAAERDFLDASLDECREVASCATADLEATRARLAAVLDLCDRGNASAEAKHVDASVRGVIYLRGREDAFAEVAAVGRGETASADDPNSETERWRGVDALWEAPDGSRFQCCRCKRAVSAHVGSDGDFAGLCARCWCVVHGKDLGDEQDPLDDSALTTDEQGRGGWHDGDDLPDAGEWIEVETLAGACVGRVAKTDSRDSGIMLHDRPDNRHSGGLPGSWTWSDVDPDDGAHETRIRWRYIPRPSDPPAHSVDDVPPSTWEDCESATSAYPLLDDEWSDDGSLNVQAGLDAEHRAADDDETTDAAEREPKCEECGGTGGQYGHWDDAAPDCDACDGAGTVPDSRRTSDDADGDGWHTEGLPPLDEATKTIARLEEFLAGTRTTCERRTAELLETTSVLHQMVMPAAMGQGLDRLRGEVLRLRGHADQLPFGLTVDDVTAGLLSEISEFSAATRQCHKREELGDVLTLAVHLAIAFEVSVLDVLDEAADKLRCRLDLIDAGLTWEQAKAAHSSKDPSVTQMVCDVLRLRGDDRRVVAMTLVQRLGEGVQP